MKPFIFVKIVLFCLIISIGAFSQAGLQRFHYNTQKMGSDFELILYHTDSSQVQLLANLCYATVDSVNAACSDYDYKSEIRVLEKTYKKGQWMKPSPLLFEILTQCDMAYKQSGGVFDASLGRLSKLWRAQRLSQKISSRAEVTKAKSWSGWHNINLKNNLIRINIDSLQFDFGGIAKGYAAQRCSELLQIHGVEIHLVNAAGNMAIGKKPPGEKGWKIGVELPNKLGLYRNTFLSLQNTSISTSGSSYQLVEIDGKRYSHILDTKTGRGLTHHKQVSIITAKATDADWLSTACTIISTQKALTLAKRMNAQILIVDNKAKQQIVQSLGFEQYINE